MNNKLSIILSIAIIIVLTAVTYGWMQTDPSVGESVEYDRHFYITDSDIDVALYVLVNNSYVLQGQLPTDELITIDNAYPGQIQRYRFTLTNNNDVDARVKISFTNLGGSLNLLRNYLIFNSTNPDLFSFKLNDRLEYDDEYSRYYFDFVDSVKIPASSSINYYWNIEIDVDAPNALQGSTFTVGTIMFVKPS